VNARLTGGVARGRAVHGRVADGVRPTSERAREALFSIIGQDLAGQTVLDAFGGTGLLGLEAWSRGARVTIVEKDRRILADIRARADAIGADVITRPGDALALGATLGRFDGVIADPPWALDVGPIAAALGPLATRWFVLEADAKTTAPDRLGALPLDRMRSYGRSNLWVYREA
jgi:16S rRNA (guanine966-N2)-methyltransferase